MAITPDVYHSSALYSQIETDGLWVDVVFCTNPKAALTCTSKITQLVPDQCLKAMLTPTEWGKDKDPRNVVLGCQKSIIYLSDKAYTWMFFLLFSVSILLIVKCSYYF